MGEMTFSFRDLYPNYKTMSEETSQKTNADYEDQEALNEDYNLVQQVDQTNASRKKVFIAMGVMVALIVLFGGK